MPTCSGEYALEAVDTNGGLARGGQPLRLSRCHPWGSSGYDRFEIGNSRHPWAPWRYGRWTKWAARTDDPKPADWAER